MSVFDSSAKPKSNIFGRLWSVAKGTGTAYNRYIGHAQYKGYPASLL
jgi:hypothetical protein